MYDELVKELRHLDEYSKQINPTPSGIFKEAADAIEELQKPVPKVPHGRLIDADALDSSETDLLGNHIVYLVDINDAPTIIPAEEG